MGGRLRESGPIRVRSILTIKTSVCSAKRNLTSEFATVAAEGMVKRLCTPANMAPPIRDGRGDASTFDLISPFCVADVQGSE